MLAVYLHGLWLCSLVRSPFRCEVAFSPSSLQKACLYLVSTTAHQGSQYLLQAAGKEDMTE
jgi:hypothetical protein